MGRRFDDYDSDDADTRQRENWRRRSDKREPPQPQTSRPPRPPQRGTGDGRRYRGTIKSPSARGFTFIICPDLHRDVFAAARQFDIGIFDTLVPGMEVEFALAPDERQSGREQAVACVVLTEGG